MELPVTDLPSAAPATVLESDDLWAEDTRSFQEQLPALQSINLSEQLTLSPMVQENLSEQTGSGSNQELVISNADLWAGLEALELPVISTFAKGVDNGIAGLASSPELIDQSNRDVFLSGQGSGFENYDSNAGAWLANDFETILATNTEVEPDFAGLSSDTPFSAFTLSTP